MIGEILAFNDHELERRHDFIQWLFALPEPSRAQAVASIMIKASTTSKPMPVLSFLEDEGEMRHGD
jgi:hypothetical protein